MIIEQKDSHSLKILAPAKLNLFLEVLGKRDDGYHELDTVMHSVTLYDTLEIQRKGDDPVLEVSGRDTGPVEHNLALKAARLFMDRSGTNIGFQIRMEKQIPVGGGLGGGSSDCAAVLLGCNLLSGQPFIRDELLELAAELGSDVPFFLFCGTARCRGRGEIVEPISGVPDRHFLVIFPGISLSTRRVYENLNLDLTKCKNVNRFVNALLKPENESVISECQFNRLERSALASEPTLFQAFEKARRRGLKSLRLTGSGSSFFQAVKRQEAEGNSTELFNIDSHWESFLVQSSPKVSI
ncbi:MAG: 4-(cytidine 5'-diphospho)-2-C-methyl-D-erythritol kinase [Planctomycetota bacterium]|jgi:4-diphosphocytidyl-2-C-methyl-D-erythritol kinase